MSDASRIAGSIARLAVLLMLACSTAAAATVDDLYVARTIVTGQEEKERLRGFAACLEDVLVKVSGDPRLIGDPAVAAMAERAGALVDEFLYRDRMSGISIHDEQGTRDRPFDLTVSFNPAKIDAALRSLGREPWTAPRPRVAVFVGVRTAATTYMLAGDDDRGRDQEEALDAAAWQTGIPIALPSRAALVQAGLSFEKLPAVDFPELDTTAKAIGGDLALAGHMVWSDEALGWSADWRLALEGRAYQWQIRGVNFDDAFRSAMRGVARILSGHGQPD